jgi:hypothetical protein
MAQRMDAGVGKIELLAGHDQEPLQRTGGHGA